MTGRVRDSVCGVVGSCSSLENAKHFRSTQRRDRSGRQTSNPVLKRAGLSAAAYFASAALTLQLTRFDGGVAIVWLAGAVLFARLCTTARRHWPINVAACLPAGILAACLFGYGRGVGGALGCIGVVEAWGAAWLVKRFCPRFGRFDSISEVARFLSCACAVAPVVSATVGASLANRTGAAFWPTWINWYAAHALGFAVFGPPLVLACRGEPRRWLASAVRAKRLEAAVLLSIVALTSLVTFGQNVAPVVVLPLAAMMVTTFRLGRFGAAVSIVLLVGIGMACSLAGRGPTTLLAAGMTLKLQVLQLYFATVVVTLLPVAAELTARCRLVERLKTAEAMHRVLLDRSTNVVMRLSEDGTIRYASPALFRLTHHTPDQVVGRWGLDLVAPEDVQSMQTARCRALAAPEETVAVEYRMKRGPDLVWVESHMRAIVGADGRATGTVTFIRDITDRRRTMEQLSQEAATDVLTGLPNRAPLTTRWPRSLRRIRRRVAASQSSTSTTSNRSTIATVIWQAIKFWCDLPPCCGPPSDRTTLQREWAERSSLCFSPGQQSIRRASCASVYARGSRRAQRWSARDDSGLR